MDTLFIIVSSFLDFNYLFLVNNGWDSKMIESIIFYSYKNLFAFCNAERLSFFDSGLSFAIIGNSFTHSLAVIGLISISPI